MVRRRAITHTKPGCPCRLLKGKKTNSSPLPIAVTVALEMIGPIARALIKRSQPTSHRARTSISLDKLPIRSWRWCQSPARILDDAQTGSPPIVKTTGTVLLARCGARAEATSPVAAMATTPMPGWRTHGVENVAETRATEAP